MPENLLPGNCIDKLALTSNQNQNNGLAFQNFDSAFPQIAFRFFTD